MRGLHSGVNKQVRGALCLTFDRLCVLFPHKEQGLSNRFYVCLVIEAVDEGEGADHTTNDMDQGFHLVR